MRLSTTLGLLLAAGPLVAQARDVCPTGPGAAFGIVAYQCANCGFRQGTRPIYSFFAEPVVVEANGRTGVAAGDVIEAVNDKPITTTAGAEAFAYPATGSNSLAIRRGRDRQQIRVSVGSACGSNNRIQLPLDDIESVEVLKGSAATVLYGSKSGDGAGAIVIKTKGGQSSRDAATAVTPRQRSSDPLIFIDGVAIGRTDAAYVGRFGFASTCDGCIAATGRDGPLIFTYYKYHDYPPITAIGPGSAAERAGLLVGDVIVKVEGRSVLDDEGAKGLARLERVDVVHLTVFRGGKEVDFTLKLSDKQD